MSFSYSKLNKYTKISSFSTIAGATEAYLTIDSEEKAYFIEELDSLYESYTGALEKTGFDSDSLVFSRIYLSDIANQKGFLLESKIYEVLKTGAVSIVQQSPVNGNSVSLLSYHIKPLGKKLKKKFFNFDNESWQNALLIESEYYSLLLTANFYGKGHFDSYKQTTGIFNSFIKILGENSMNMLDNSIRTWVFVRDIDNHYNGMVVSRREFFSEHGLTQKTRYIASTGIEGTLKEVDTLVSLDALSIKGIKSEQILRMEALENLSPTIKYGVTFERGTCVRFGDRSHLYISGTASVDKEGKIAHPGNVRKQTSRTIENIKALLAPYGAGLNDMGYLVVYLRSFKDRKKVLEILDKEIPAEIPYLFVEAAVCRPGWLVELEGVAVVPDSSDFPPFM